MPADRLDAPRPVPFRQEVNACVPPPGGRLDPPEAGRAEATVNEWSRRHGAPSPELRHTFIALATDLDRAHRRAGSADGARSAAALAAGLDRVRGQSRRSWRLATVSRPHRPAAPSPPDLDALADELTRSWSVLCFGQPRWFAAWQGAARWVGRGRRQARRAGRLGRRLAGSVRRPPR